MQSVIDIKNLRKTVLKLSQSAFAEMVGVDQTTVSGWENGKKPSRTASKVIERLAEDHTSADAAK